MLFTLARILSCGIWFLAGLFKLTHFKHTSADMANRGIPYPALFLVLTIALELGGSAMLFANVQVWLVALSWICFHDHRNPRLTMGNASWPARSFFLNTFSYPRTSPRRRTHRPGASRSGPARLAEGAVRLTGSPLEHTQTLYAIDNRSRTMIKAAIVGLGWWGKTLVEAVQGRSEDIRFRRRRDRNAHARGPEFTKAQSIALRGSYDELLADPNVDAWSWPRPIPCMSRRSSRRPAPGNMCSARSRWR